MPDLDTQTMLVVLAGVAVFLAVVMVGFATQRVHPGFGLWTLCQALIAVACVALALRGLPAVVLDVVGPGIILVGATLRLEGLRRFFGREEFDYRSLAIPAIGIVLLVCFSFAMDSLSGREVIVTVVPAVLFWAMAAVIIPKARGNDRGSYLVFGSLFLLYGAFLVGCGVAWSVQTAVSPLSDSGWAGLVFYIFVIFFEITWVFIFLSMNARRTAETLAAAGRAAELRRDQLADLLAFLPDATFAVDDKRVVIAWNRAAEQLTGVAAPEVLGRPFNEKAGAALGDQAGALLELVLGSGEQNVPPVFRRLEREEGRVAAEAEIEFPGRPGAKRHLWLAVTALREAGGRAAGAVESIRDVGNRENAARVIRQREEQFRKLFELNLDGILAVAPDGAIQDANPAACEMLGMTKEEIRAVGPAGIIQMDDDAHERFEKGPPTERVLTPFTYRRKDGTTFPGEWMSVAYCDALGSPRGFVVFRDISEREKAQKVLRESEARLLRAQAVAHVGDWEIDLEARSIWMSPEALHIHGAPETSNYFALDLDELTKQAEDPAAVRAELERFMLEGGDYELEYRIRRLDDGASRTIHAKGLATIGPSGRPVRLRGVVQDVTELKQVEDALRGLQPSVDQTRDLVFWADSEGRLIFVNDSMCEQLGYTRDELLSMKVFDIDCTPPEQRSPDLAEWWERIKQQGSLTHDAVYCRKDGGEIPVRVVTNYSTLNNEEHSFVVARDVTEQKRMEEVARSAGLSEGDGAGETVWLDREGRVVLANDAACRRLGYTCDELLRMTVYDVDPLLSKAWRETWDKVKRRGTVKQEAVHRTKDGRDVPVELTSSYIEHDGKEFNVVRVRDVSDRGRAEDTISENQERMGQAVTMDAIGRLAGGIAHDFNNLLTAIMGYGGLILADEQVQGSSVHQDAEEIRSAAERASALTQKILSFSRRRTLRPRVVSLNEILPGMEARLREVLGSDIEIASMLSSEAGFVEVDPGLFEEAVMNLATNARDAMPGRGRFIIETESTDVSEDYRELYPDLQPGAFVTLSVSDTGRGMSPDTLAHCFEPFFTTKSAGAGAGLGLSTVYGFVRQSGGFVNVYSEVDKGTTFKVYLPRVPEPAKVEAVEPPTDSAGAKGGAETILVVEDEAPLRRLVARVLGGLGYRVFVAGSGPEAVELVDNLDDPPDLLLTDVVLPGGMQGNDVAAALLARAPGLPVLYMSGHARDAIVHWGRLDEGVSFLSKPFTPETLAARVREVLDAGGPHPAQGTPAGDRPMEGRYGL